MQGRQTITGQKRKSYDSENKVLEVKEKKQKENDITVTGIINNPAGIEKNNFLEKLYQEKAVYFKDLQKDKNGDLIQDKCDEYRLTIQVNKLVENIIPAHFKYLKEDIYREIEKKSKPLTEDQKKYINIDINILDESNDPIKNLFAKCIRSAKLIKWHDVSKRYFSSFHETSVMQYHENLSDEEKEKRAMMRRVLFHVGKEYLEDLLFQITRPPVNATKAKKALYELHHSIGVCGHAFLGELQSAVSIFSKSFTTILNDKKLEICKQAASIYTLEIINRRKVTPLYAESKLKNLTEDDQEFTHAVSELTNDISENTDYGIPISLDLRAENYFSKSEKEEFREKFLVTARLQKSIIEALYAHYLEVMNDVNSFEKVTHFFAQLDQMGHLHEEPTVYFDEDPYRVKTHVDVSKILRESIIKRLLLSDCLGDMFVTKSVKKIEEDKFCDIVLTTIPYKKNCDRQNDLLFGALPKNGRPYSYLLQDRNILSFGLSDAKNLSISNIDAFIHYPFWVAYAVVKQKNQQSELYFLQNKPERIRKVALLPAKQRILERTLKDIGPFDSKPSPLAIDIEKIKSLDPEERYEKVIHFVKKTHANSTYQVLSNIPENQIKFNKIIRDLQFQENENKEFGGSPFVFTDPKSIEIIMEHTKHCPFDTLYINQENIFDSIVTAPRFLIEGQDAVLMILEYLKKVTDHERYLVLKEIDPFLTRNFIMQMQPFLSNECLQKTFNRRDTARLVKSYLNHHHFSLASQLLTAIPIKLPTKYTSAKWYQETLRTLIDENDANKIKKFFQFCITNHMDLALILAPYHGVTPMEHAAKNSQSDALNALLQILRKNNLSSLLQGERHFIFQFSLKKGLDLYIENECYSDAYEFMVSYNLSQYLSIPKLLAKIEAHCDRNEVDKLDELLDKFSLNPELLKKFFFEAAKGTHKEIIDVFMKHGLDDELEGENNEGFFEHIELGILNLLYSNKYIEALDIINHYSVQFGTINLPEVYPDMKKYLIKNIGSTDPEIIDNVKALIEIFKGKNVPAIENNLRLYLGLCKNDNGFSKMLIDSKVDLNFQDEETKKGYLHVACENKNYEMVRYLVQANVPFDLQDKVGATAFQLDISRNLKVFLLLQLLKKYLQLTSDGDPLKLRHLDYILKSEEESIYDAKTEWGKVLSGVKQIKIIESPLTASSIFQKERLADHSYLEIIQTPSQTVMYHLLAERLHVLQSKSTQADLSLMLSKSVV